MIWQLIKIYMEHKFVGWNPLSKVFFHTTFRELNLLPSSGEGFVIRTIVFIFIFYFYFIYSGLAVTGIRTRKLFRSSVLWITSRER